jgi:hypothetical protein
MGSSCGRGPCRSPRSRASRRRGRPRAQAGSALSCAPRATATACVRS